MLPVGHSSPQVVNLPACGSLRITAARWRAISPPGEPLLLTAPPPPSSPLNYRHCTALFWITTFTTYLHSALPFRAGCCSQRAAFCWCGWTYRLLTFPFIHFFYLNSCGTWQLTMGWMAHPTGLQVPPIPCRLNCPPAASTTPTDWLVGLFTTARTFCLHGAP